MRETAERSRGFSLAGALAVAVVVAAILGAPRPASAQRPDPYITTSRAELKSSLAQGIGLAERAMNIVQSSTDLGDLRRAQQMAEKGYLEFNRARGHLANIQLRQKFPDPMVDYTLKIIDQARQALAQANSKTGHIIAFEGQRAENTSMALQYYSSALQHARRAAEFSSL
jgi:hypothetical protein